MRGRVSRPRTAGGRSSSSIVSLSASATARSMSRSSSLTLPGPVVADERVHRGRLTAGRGAAIGGASRKCCGQHRNVGATLAQRRDPDVHSAQPVEQVRPKQPALDQAGEAPVRGGDDPDVDAMGAVPPTRSTLRS